MTFVYPEIDTVFDTEADRVNTLVIENPGLLRRLAEDLTAQLDGAAGRAVLAENGRLLPIAKGLELLDRFVPFDLNKKTLLNRICAALEKEAVSDGFYYKTAELISDAERYLADLAFRLPGGVSFSGLTAGALIRAAGARVECEGCGICEKLLDYFELVGEYDRKKLFVTLNLRAFVGDGEAELFLDTALSHGYNLLMIESADLPRLSKERRYIVDRDLCEIG